MLSGAMMLLPFFKTSSQIAYTFLSVSVSHNGVPSDSSNTPTSNLHAFWPQQSKTSNNQCRYLAGGVHSLSVYYSKTRNTCDMRDAGGEYTRGSWLRNCGLEQSTLRGKQLQYAGYAKSYVPTARHEACYKAPDASVVDLKTEGLLFTYHPDNCELVSFNSMILAEMLRRNKFYFVGDSLTEQFVHSVGALTGVAPHFNKSYILVNHKTLRPMNANEWNQCMDSERKRMAKRMQQSTGKTLQQLSAAERKYGVCGGLADPYLFCMAETIRAEQHDEWALPELPAHCPTDTYRHGWCCDSVARFARSWNN